MVSVLSWSSIWRDSANSQSFHSTAQRKAGESALDDGEDAMGSVQDIFLGDFNVATWMDKRWLLLAQRGWQQGKFIHETYLFSVQTGIRFSPFATDRL